MDRSTNANEDTLETPRVTPARLLQYVRSMSLPSHPLRTVISATGLHSTSEMEPWTQPRGVQLALGFVASSHVITPTSITCSVYCDAFPGHINSLLAFMTRLIMHAFSITLICAF